MIHQYRFFTHAFSCFIMGSFSSRISSFRFSSVIRSRVK